MFCSGEIKEPLKLLTAVEKILIETFKDIPNSSITIFEKGTLIAVLPMYCSNYDDNCDLIHKHFYIFRENIARYLNFTTSAFLSNECSSLEDVASLLRKDVFSMYKVDWGANGQFLTAQSSTRDGIRRVVEYISKNLDRRLDLKELADIAAMSECYFSHIFKEEKGIGPKEYVVVQKIAKAKELLAETKLKVGAIAAQVGMSNTNYFSSIFKKTTKLTPIEYRESVLSDR